MRTQTESERLYVVETKLDTVLHAVEQTNSKIDSLGASLNSYATKEQLEQAIADRNAQIAALELGLKELGKRHNLTVWLTSTLSAMAGVVLTLLIQQAFR